LSAGSQVLDPALDAGRDAAPAFVRDGAVEAIGTRVDVQSSVLVSRNSGSLSRGQRVAPRQLLRSSSSADAWLLVAYEATLSLDGQREARFPSRSDCCAAGRIQQPSDQDEIAAPRPLRKRFSERSELMLRLRMEQSSHPARLVTTAFVRSGALA
jgi:hypothetical protein